MDRRSAGILITSIEAIRAHLDRGAPWDACDAFREAALARPQDAELLYWGALAHARAGATRTAHALLDRAQIPQDSPLLAESLSLRGRLWKDAFEHAADDAAATALGVRARDEYRRAYAINCGSYPAINAATMSMLLGDAAEARRLSAAIVADCATTAASSSNAWGHATLGEAKLLLGHVDEAKAHYAAAFRACNGGAGSVAAMRRQLRLLARVLPEACDMLAVLPVPNVVAFAGHMIDAPDRTVPRFPASIESAVMSALRERLRTLGAPVIYTSAACGSDLLLAEVALDAGCELNVVLPFDRADFVRTSVAVGGAAWVERFDAVLARASRVIMATEEGYLEDDVLFEHAALLVEGLAMLRAGQLQTEPTLLCVLDPQQDVRIGGTRASVERWRASRREPLVIDLRALRANAVAANPPVSAAGTSLHGQGVSGVDAKRPRRALRTMLFADFAGYSRLQDAFVPLFQQRFFDIAAGVIEAARIKPLEAKTWGDALYAVFESATEGAAFALEFLERMLAVDWTVAGLADTSQVRVALHAGPVFRGRDPVMQSDSHFGSAVVRAARIEPVTPPGMVYASEAFAATLAATGQRDYGLEYIGTVSLAKGYGASRIYRLERCGFR